MRSSFPLIAGNGLAIALTVVIVLPVIAVLAFAGTAPLDDFTANMGLALHDRFEWSVERLVTE